MKYSHMTARHFKVGRAASIAAALLSLTVVAACGSATGGEQKVPVANTASIAPIPDVFPVSSMSEQLQQVGDRVRFDLDSYALTPDGETTLQKQAALLQQYPEVVVTIEGHADERGTREYNLALGERRADTVRNYMIALGIPGDRISVVSYGKERPECAEADDGCWAMNRRGVTVASQ